MALKRSQPDSDTLPDDGNTAKKIRTGFKVGPDHLPDGSRRRRAHKIKSHLIQKAKVKRKYAKVRERELGTAAANEYARTSSAHHRKHDASDGEAATNEDAQQEKTVDQSDSRRTGLDLGERTQHKESLEQPTAADHEDNRGEDSMHPDRRQLKRSKAPPFQKELQQAEKRRTERDAARQVRDEAIEERNRKREERERWRRQMAKARKPGKNGQRKLGRESKVLLEKVQRLVGS